MIRVARPIDAAQLCTIYNHYVGNSVVTFEEVSVTTEDMVQRIEKGIATMPWYVFEKDDEVLGYCYASAWKTRSAYRHSVESTVYVSAGQGKQSVGTRLYQRLLADLRARGIHVVLAGIALPNLASVALHQKLGFMQVAQLREVGRKFDRWVDVGYWELMLPEDS